jgi:anti-sigma factor RsiW
MCPDRELLSAWLDGEVPSPWRETIETHLHGCARCAGLVQGYKELRASLFAGAEGREDEAKARVLSRIYASAPRKLYFWTRRVSLPLPAAAAAAIAVGILAFALALSGARTAELRMAMQNAVQSAPSVASSVGMEGILEFLARQDAGVNITITLPAGSPEQASGAPFMIREADYKPGSGK